MRILWCGDCLSVRPSVYHTGILCRNSRADRQAIKHSIVARDSSFWMPNYFCISVVLFDCLKQDSLPGIPIGALSRRGVLILQCHTYAVVIYHKLYKTKLLHSKAAFTPAQHVARQQVARTSNMLRAHNWSFRGRLPRQSIDNQSTTK